EYTHLSMISATVDPTSASAAKCLGLHLDEQGRLSVWWYIGQVWLGLGGAPHECILRVLPKVDTRAFRMYQECVGDDVVRAHLGDTISIFWDEPPIPVEFP